MASNRQAGVTFYPVEDIFIHQMESIFHVVIAVNHYHKKQPVLLMNLIHTLSEWTGKCRLFIIIAGIAACSLPASDIVLSPGNLKVSERKVQPGDRILLSGGRYAEPVRLAGLKGTGVLPITIAPVPGETVVFDGTDVLDDDWEEVTPDSAAGKLIQPAQWQRIMGKVYSQQLDAPVYALIYKDRLMSDARWPNSRWDDPWRLDRYMVLRRADVESVKGRLQDGLPTDNTLEESSQWLHYDRSNLSHRDEMLGDTGISFAGAVVLMSHTWGSWATRVTAHDAGSDFFEYDDTFEGSGSIRDEALGFLNNRIGWKSAKNSFHRSSHGGIHFFFMGLPALDIAEEWWYHEPTKTLYFITPDGNPPQAGEVRGKRRDFLLTVEDSDHVRIRGFEFIGSAAQVSECSNSRLEDSNFKFGSYHKFTVGNFDIPVTTRIENRGNEHIHGNALVNCRFTYLDGNAFEGRSFGLVIDNVLIYRTQQTTLGLDSRSMSIKDPSMVRRVTIDDVGASVGIRGGGMDGVYELNNIMHFGGLQYDGASLQMGGREKFVYRYNWSHDHPKRSYRFDAGSYPDYSNAYGEMSYNVAWNTPGGFAIKGDDHLIHNNVLLGDAGFELFNMKRWAGKNERTLVANNIVAFLSAGSYDWDQPVLKKRTDNPNPLVTDDYWMSETKVEPGHPTIVGQGQSYFDDGNESRARKAPLLAILKNNYHEDTDSVLRDPANLDFRPRSDCVLIDSGHAITRAEVPWKEIPITGSSEWRGTAPDIGAYESGSSHYWVPGFQFPHASTPVPPNGTATAKPDCSLMWLAGYKADTHHLYAGFSEREVTNATFGDGVYRATFKGSANVFDFAKPLPSGTTLYWRVDAERDGVLIKGETWSFTTR